MLNCVPDVGQGNVSENDVLKEETEVGLAKTLVFKTKSFLLLICSLENVTICSLVLLYKL